MIMQMFLEIYRIHVLLIIMNVFIFMPSLGPL